MGNQTSHVVESRSSLSDKARERDPQSRDPSANSAEFDGMVRSVPRLPERPARPSLAPPPLPTRPYASSPATPPVTALTDHSVFTDGTPRQMMAAIARGVLPPSSGYSTTVSSTPSTDMSNSYLVVRSSASSSSAISERSPVDSASLLMRAASSTPSTSALPTSARSASSPSPSPFTSSNHSSPMSPESSPPTPQDSGSSMRGPVSTYSAKGKLRTLSEAHSVHTESLRRAWYMQAGALHPNPSWNPGGAGTGGAPLGSAQSEDMWARPELVYAWTVQPSCPRVWQRIVREQTINVDLHDRWWAAELSKPWLYLVLFVSIDVDAHLHCAGGASFFEYQLRSVIESKQCQAMSLRFFFARRFLREHEALLERIVVAFVPREEAEELTSSLLGFVNYPLDPLPPSPAVISCINTAGYSFVSGRRHFVATSLHGRVAKHLTQQLSSGAVHSLVMADAFSSSDDKIEGAQEAGQVVCDWRNDYVDVGLIQLLDEHTLPDTWYTEAEVTDYMLQLMRKTFDTEYLPLPVRIHSPPCLGQNAGAAGVPGRLVEVRCIGRRRSGDLREYHFVVQLDAGYQVLPGQSGSAVTLVDESGLVDGQPIGMLVAALRNNPSVAIVTPLHHIYASLNAKLPAERRVRLCSCHRCPTTIATSRRATKLITHARVYCVRCQQPLRVGPPRCCDEQRDLAQAAYWSLQDFLSTPAHVPALCAFWGRPGGAQQP